MRIALALGSGGARGYAHIGVIQEIEDRGHQIVGISGASMGAVVGGMYAADKLDDLEGWFRSLGQRDVLRLLDVSFTGGGAIRANRVMAKIRELCDGARIEELPMRYTAVATDLLARREVWFTRGPLDEALRASFAIPSIITPATIGGRHMVDGGVINPVPMEPLATVDADVLMAVSLTGRREGQRRSTVHGSSAPGERGETLEGEETEPADQASGGSSRKIVGPISQALNQNLGALGERLREASEARGGNEYIRQLTGRLATQLEAAGSANQPEDGSAAEDTVADQAVAALPGTLGLFDVVVQSIDAMESVITNYRMAGHRPDILVNVPADTCTAFDFHRADEVIEVGRQLTAAKLDRAGL